MTDTTDTTDAQTTTELPKAYHPADFEAGIYERWLAADVFAPDGAGSPGRRLAAAVHDHPAAAEHHRLAPPRPRPANDRRGPDDPPRPDARPADAVPAGPRPRLDRRPVRPRPDHREGRRVAGSRSGASATSSGCRQFVDGDARGHARPAAAASAGRSTGAASGSRWTTARRGPSARRSTRLYRDGLAYRDRGAHQLVPGLPDERVATSRSSRTPRRARSGRSATT